MTRYMQPFVNTGRIIPIGWTGRLSFIKKACSTLMQSVAQARVALLSSCRELGRISLPSLDGTALVHMKRSMQSLPARSTWLSYEPNGSLTEPQKIASDLPKPAITPGLETCCGLNDCVTEQCIGKKYRFACPR